MLFTSFEFIVFLLLVFVLYYALPKKSQWVQLLVFSYVFYFIADPRYLIFIVVTTVSTYLVSLKLKKINDITDGYIKEHKELTRDEKKAYKAQMKAKKWRWLLLCLILNIGILSVTKYTNFVINNINNLLSGSSQLKAVDMIIPMGISFYTFQTMGYIIDVYRGKHEPQKNPFKLALFVSFFPQLVQGPISRYGDLSKTLFSEHKFDCKVISSGIMRILWGYFKKVVIADRLISAVTTLVSETETYVGAYVFVAMMFYAFELYCDFTGGIDITIGIAEVLGITLAENFNLPYFSKNIKEYWNRWHITMGSWFTDYIFYPISVCGPMLKLSKWSRSHLGDFIGKRVPVYLSSFVVWLTTGIWHGAAWNFIVWGLMNFVVIMISQELEPLYAKFHSKFNVKGKMPYEIFQIIRTILLMSCIRMFDCYRDVPLTFKMIGTMFTEINPEVIVNGALLNIGLTMWDYLVLLVGLIVVLGVSIVKVKVGTIRDKLYEKPFAYYGLMGLMLVTIIVFGAYGVGYDSSQFIYNQF
ncbi:MAG: MBOAT family protein [Lachnospiraceae bacterium]|nr:MBOAT family protein [Lachnospiraceae bacterium]